MASSSAALSAKPRCALQPVPSTSHRLSGPPEAAFCAAETPSDVVALAPLCPWFPLRPTLDERPRSSLPFVPAEPLDLTS